MVDDLINESEELSTPHAMWAHLQGAYRGTSIIHLQQLTIKCDTHKKCHDQNVKQHLRNMSNIITQFKSAGYVILDKKQVEAVILSLPINWEHLKVRLTYNDNIKTFYNVSRHVELEDERFGSAKVASNTFVAESSSTKSLEYKLQNNWK